MERLCYKYVPSSPCLAQIGSLKPGAAWVSKANWSHKMESMSGWWVPVAVSAPAVCSNAGFYCFSHTVQAFGFCGIILPVLGCDETPALLCTACSQHPPKSALLLLYGWQQLHDFCSALCIQTSSDLQAHGFFFFFCQPRICINKAEFGAAEYSSDICLMFVSLIG